MRINRGPLWPVLIAVLLFVGLSLDRSPAQAAGAEQLPDLQTIIPTDGPKGFSILSTPQGREFRYTHLIYNHGPGSLEVQPAYDTASGGYRGEQLIYNLVGNTWSLSRREKVPDTFVYHAAHGHFHFPLATFGLYAVGPSGGVGAPVALSPKIGFCIDDSYVYTPPNQPPNPRAGTTVGHRGPCDQPTTLRGLSISGADEYDYRDPGQAIPIDTVPNGTYWFKAVSDPYNDFAETDESNNETDVKVQISGNSVSVVPNSMRFPDTTPPTGSLAAPTDGSVVSGNAVHLTAQSPDSDVASVIFTVDGKAVGTATAPPYTAAWDSNSVVDGSHWFAARITDTSGRTSTTPVKAAAVDNSTDPVGAGISLVGKASQDGYRTARPAALTAVQGGDQLVALVSSDGPDASGQVATVTSSTSGVQWVQVVQANGQPGTATVWKATVPTGATSVSATASLPAGSAGDFDVSITLLAFRGSAGIGASSLASGSSGLAATTLTTTSPGSLVYAVGSDYDQAQERTLPDDQQIVHRWLTSHGDTLWSQAKRTSTGGANVEIEMGISAPTSRHWNMAAVEITSVRTADTDPPRVEISDPLPDATLTGNVRLAATAADSVGVARVDFLVDGAVVGTSRTPPYVMEWNSKTVGRGSHTLTAKAYDAAGNVGTSAETAVRVDNSGRPPARITIDAKVVAQGTSTLTTPALTTTGKGKLLLAFVAYDGSEGGQQGSTVSSSDGRTWTLVNSIGSQTGGVQIWSAYAPEKLSGVTVRAVPTLPGYDGQLTVLALSGASATGVSGVSARQNGTPSIYLPGVAAASWVLGVGNDPDGAMARTPVTGQVIQQQWAHRTSNDPDNGATFWVQSLAAPTTSSGLVTLAVTGPTTHQWNLAAVEVKASGGVSLRPGRPVPDPDLTNPRPRPRIPGHHG